LVSWVSELLLICSICARLFCLAISSFFPRAITLISSYNCFFSALTLLISILRCLISFYLNLRVDSTSTHFLVILMFSCLSCYTSFSILDSCSGSLRRTAEAAVEICDFLSVSTSSLRITISSRLSSNYLVILSSKFFWSFILFLKS
jgi:hypothetical protein